MKKSFLGKVLMMASFVAILGGFSSCKDYSEDRYSDLLGKLEDQNSSLNDALEVQKNDLLLQIADLEAALQACKDECAQKMKDLESNWDKNLASEVAALTAVDANLQGQIDAINALLGSNTTGKTVIEQIIEVNQAAANAAANAESALEQLKAVNATTADFEERIQALESWKTEVDALIVGWSEEVKKVAEDAAKALADAKANAERIEVMEALAQEQAEKLDSIADAMNGYASKEELEKVAEQAAKIDDVIEELKGLATKQELEEVKALAEANFVAAKAYTDQQIAFVIKTFNKKFNNVNDSIDALRNSFNELDATVDALADAMADSLNNVNESLNALKDSLLNTNLYLEALKNSVGVLEDELNNANLKIADLEEKMDSVDAVLADRLDKVESDVEALKAQVEANTTAINNLTDAFKKFITSIVLQGTKNPVFGSWSTPFNSSSNILAAYYGYAGAQGVKFPTDLPRFYVDNSNVLMTDKDLEMLNVTPLSIKPDAMIIGEEGNAGTIYMTVNPNTVDFSGTSFSLVNSQDEFSGVTLDTITKSDEVLNFGYSRAANNGFYEAKATVAEEDIDDLKLSLNLDEIKDVAKDLVDGGDVNVSAIATTMYNTLTAFNLEANGVKASWTDTYGEHSTYSQYGIAVTAVKPLSYSFGKDFSFTQVPGLDRMESFIGKLTEKVKAAIKKTDKVLNIELIEIEKIKVPATPQVDSIEVIVYIDKQVVDNGMGGTITIPADTITTKVSIQYVVDQLYGELAGSFNDVNAMLENVKDLMDKVNDMIQTAKNLQASSLNAADKVQAKLTSFLNKFNSKFCNALNSANKVLRPVMFVSTQDGFHKLSQAANNPTVISGATLDLIPTSYTMEYIAPSFKKLVGVTNVFKGAANAQAGDADCKAALNKVNAQAGVAEILAGDTYVVSATFEAGYVYEVVYTAVDFFGMVDTKKFYVTVK